MKWKVLPPYWTILEVQAVSKVLKVFVYQNMGIINTNVREILSAKLIFFTMRAFGVLA
jgi:hypothetical protein